MHQWQPMLWSVGGFMMICYWIFCHLIAEHPSIMRIINSKCSSTISSVFSLSLRSSKVLPFLHLNQHPLAEAQCYIHQLKNPSQMDCAWSWTFSLMSCNEFPHQADKYSAIMLKILLKLLHGILPMITFFCIILDASITPVSSYCKK